MTDRVKRCCTEMAIRQHGEYAAELNGHKLSTTPVCSVDSLVQYNWLGPQKEQLVLQSLLGLQGLHEHFR